jgi:hypothetical protein
MRRAYVHGTFTMAYHPSLLPLPRSHSYSPSPSRRCAGPKPSSPPRPSQIPDAHLVIVSTTSKCSRLRATVANPLESADFLPMARTALEWVHARPGGGPCSHWSQSSGRVHSRQVRLFVGNALGCKCVVVGVVGGCWRHICVCDRQGYRRQVSCPRMILNGDIIGRRVNAHFLDP